MEPPRNAVEGCAIPGPRPFPSPAVLSFVSDSRVEWHLAGDGPHEGRHLASDGGDDDVGVFAAGDQSAEAAAETDLGLPGDVADGLGQTLEALLDVWRDLGGEAIGPGALDENATGVSVAGLGDAAETATLAGGVHAGDESEEAGELTGVVEARDVAELGGDGDGDGALDAAHGLEGADDRGETPALHLVAQLGLETQEARHLLVDGLEHLLVDDLLGGCRADDAREIAAVGVVPVGAAGVGETETEEEGLQAVLGGLQDDDRVLAGPREVTHRFVLDRGNVDGLEIPAPQQPGQGDGVAAISLDAVARFAWNEGRRNDQAGDTPAAQMPVQDVAAGPGFVGDDEALRLVPEAAEQPVDVGHTSADAPVIGDLGAPVVGSVGDRDGVLVDIETDEQRGGFLHG